MKQIIAMIIISNFLMIPSLGFTAGHEKNDQRMDKLYRVDM